MEFIRKVLRTEPVRIAALLQSIAALVAAFTNLIDPAQAAVIISAIVSVHEVVRSLVFSPDTVQALLDVPGVDVIELIRNKDEA